MTNLVRKPRFALLYACFCSIVLTSPGCATPRQTGPAQPPTSELSTSSDGAAAPADSKAGDGARARSPWVYPHGNHMHTFPWHKGQKPSFPAEGK